MARRRGDRALSDHRCPQHMFYQLKFALKAELQSPFFLELRTVQRLGNWDIDLEEELIPSKRTDLRVKRNAKRRV